MFIGMQTWQKNENIPKMSILNLEFIADEKDLISCHEILWILISHAIMYLSINDSKYQKADSQINHQTKI